MLTLVTINKYSVIKVNS